MRKNIMLIALSATVLLLVAGGGFTARSTAGQATPEPASSRFIGAWHVHFVIEGRPVASSLTTFTSDGIVLTSNQLAARIPSGVPADLVMQSGGQGAWVASGENAIDITFTLLQSDLDGNDLGTRTIRGTLALDGTGDAWSGTYTATVVDRDGEVLATSEGVVEATRIVVEPMATPAA